MRVRVKPNDKCPCGSGQKFKRCCSHPINPAPIDKAKMLEIVGTLLERSRKPTLKVCMHPAKDECSDHIIKAHSIQKKGILSRISKEGKVMMLQMGNATTEKFPLDLAEEGNSKATTFRNFCKRHDQILFQDIEDKPYQQTEKQNFLYAYRVFAMQAYKKRVSYDIHLDLLKAHNKDPFLSSYLLQVLYGTKIAIDDLEYLENTFKQRLQSS